MDDTAKQDLVELLFLSLYEDGHLSIEENSMLEKALKSLGWREGMEGAPSVSEAFAAVREANSCESNRDGFLAERGGRLKEGGHATLAFEWIGKVLGSDGLDQREARFLEKARKLLF